MTIRTNTPCDIDGICPYAAEFSCSCEYWCGAEEPEDDPVFEEYSSELNYDSDLELEAAGFSVEHRWVITYIDDDGREHAEELVGCALNAEDRCIELRELGFEGVDFYESEDPICPDKDEDVLAGMDAQGSIELYPF